MRVASSFISPEQAELNLKELGDAGLEELAQQGRDRWNEVLGRVEVEGGTLDQYRTFYTCLYRSLLFLTSSMKWMPAERPCITVPRQGRYCRDIITLEPGCGIPSAVSFRC